GSPGGGAGGEPLLYGPLPAGVHPERRPDSAPGRPGEAGGGPAAPGRLLPRHRGLLSRRSPAAAPPVQEHAGGPAPLLPPGGLREPRLPAGGGGNRRPLSGRPAGGPGPSGPPPLGHDAAPAGRDTVLTTH